MKRIAVFFLALLCILVFASCKAEDNSGGAQTENEAEYENENKNEYEYYFSGKVVEVYEDSCLLEVTDTGNGNFTLNDKIIVNTNIDKCPKYDAGDVLTVSFDGKVALSYPAQVLCVYSITNSK